MMVCKIDVYLSVIQFLFVGCIDEFYSSFSFFVGIIDDLCIWKIVCSIVDIVVGMGAQFSGVQFDLVLNYCFDEISGSVVQDSGLFGLVGSVVNLVVSVVGVISGCIVMLG